MLLLSSASAEANATYQKKIGGCDGCGLMLERKKEKKVAVAEFLKLPSLCGAVEKPAAAEWGCRKLESLASCREHGRFDHIT